MKAICIENFPWYRFTKDDVYTVQLRELSYGVLNETQKTWYNFYRDDVDLSEQDLICPKFKDYFEIIEE